MKPINIATASGILLVMAMAGPAVGAGMSEGQSGASSSEATFNDLDTNLDGKLTKQEARKRPGLVSNWQQADSNGDQQVDSTEFAAFEIEQDSQSQSSPPSEMDSGSGGNASPPRQY